MSLKKTGLLEGKRLTVGTMDLPPYILFHPLNGTTLDSENLTAQTIRIDGFVHEIMNYFSKRFQFEYTYELPRDMAFGAIVNGSWNGIIGMIARKELDMGATGITTTEARRTVVDFTVPFYEDPVSLLIPYPEVDGFPIEGMVKPYSLPVWGLIGMSILACSCILALVLHIENRLPEKLKGRRSNKGTSSCYCNLFWMSFWSLFRVLVNGDHFSTVNPLPIRITFGVWCFMAIIIVNAYQGNLVANLTATSQRAMIDSIEDLVSMFSSKTQEVQFLVPKNSAFETAVLAATGGTLARVRENLIKHPENALSRELTDLLDLVALYRRTFAAERTSHLFRIDKDFKATGKCRLSIAKKPYDVSRSAFALPKSSPLTSIFDNELNRIRETGLLEHWMRLYTPRPNKCLAPLLGAGSSTLNRPRNVSYNSRRKLTLAYLLGSFLLLGVGLSASLAVFLYEQGHGIRNQILCRA